MAQVIYTPDILQNHLSLKIEGEENLKEKVEFLSLKWSQTQAQLTFIQIKIENMDYFWLFKCT